MMVIFTYRSCTTKNQRILSTSFESDFTFTPTQISIVRPQVTVQTDDIFRRSFRVISIFCRDIINVDAPTGINLQIIFSIVQLFHDDDIMVIHTIGDFDETVVGSLRIRVLGYGFRSLRIVVGRVIGIDLTIRQLFPLDGIAGDIAYIMAESNGIRFIRRSLIADGRAIFRRDDCLMASCQSIFRIFASRTACNAHRIVAIYTAVIASPIILSIAANRCCSCSKCIVGKSAKYG